MVAADMSQRTGPRERSQLLQNLRVNVDPDDMRNPGFQSSLQLRHRFVRFSERRFAGKLSFESYDQALAGHEGISNAGISRLWQC